MQSKQDRREIPPYVAQTAREIVKPGPGRHGNMESKADAEARGMSPKPAAEAAARAAQADGAKPRKVEHVASPVQIPSDRRN